MEPFTPEFLEPFINGDCEINESHTDGTPCLIRALVTNFDFEAFVPPVIGIQMAWFVVQEGGPDQPWVCKTNVDQVYGIEPQKGTTELVEDPSDPKLTAIRFTPNNKTSVFTFFRKGGSELDLSQVQGIDPAHFDGRQRIYHQGLR